jgi:cell division septum initiation protein DivIVA
MPDKEKHTPRPWKAGVTPSDGRRIALVLKGADVPGAHDVYHDVQATRHRIEEQESAANAHLIAAAPDLLAACEEMLEAVPPEEDGAASHRQAVRASRVARKAIAKARGLGDSSSSDPPDDSNTSEYAPTPWHVATSGEITDWPERRVEAAEETVARVYYHQTPNGEAIQQANARRIVACVNFCEGVRTADLEESIERGDTLADSDEAIVAKLNEVGEERNDLRDENERLKERVAELEEACGTVLKWVAHDFKSGLPIPEGTPDAGEAERILRDALSGKNASREAGVPHE